MPNEFVTTKLIARQILPRLLENLLMPNLCYKDYSNTFQKQGDTIRVKKPVVLTADEFTQGTAVTEQDVAEETTEVKLDKIATVDLSFEAMEMATNIESLSPFAEAAAIALAQKINTDGLKTYQEIPYVLGTPGATPAALTDFSAVRKQFNARKCPQPGRIAIWDTDADANFTQITNLVKVNESGSTQALREGEIGRVFGINNYMCQEVQSHTQGTAVSGNKTIAVAAAATKGATSISVDSGSAAGTLKAGDVLKIGNHYYNVAEDVAAIGTTAATVKLVQPLQADVANDAAIGLPTYTASKTGYVANLAFIPQAIAYVTRPLVAPPSGVDAYTTNYNGLSLRVVRGYDMKLKREKMSVDVLYGYKVVYPEMAMVYMG